MHKYETTIDNLQLFPLDITQIICQYLSGLNYDLNLAKKINGKLTTVFNYGFLGYEGYGYVLHRILLLVCKALANAENFDPVTGSEILKTAGFSDCKLDLDPKTTLQGILIGNIFSKNSAITTEPPFINLMQYLRGLPLPWYTDTYAYSYVNIILNCCILVDLRLIHLNGKPLTKEIHKEQPDVLPIDKMSCPRETSLHFFFEGQRPRNRTRIYYSHYSETYCALFPGETKQLKDRYDEINNDFNLRCAKFYIRQDLLTIVKYLEKENQEDKDSQNRDKEKTNIQDLINGVKNCHSAQELLSLYSSDLKDLGINASKHLYHFNDKTESLTF